MTDFTISKPGARAPIITLFGDAGTGKNSLATSLAKNPIVIRVEDGVHRQSQMLETPDAFPVCKSTKDVMGQIQWLGKNDHNYDAVFLDSVSALNRIIEDEVIETGGPDGSKASSIASACGGFGKGFSAVANKHGIVAKWLDRLREAKGLMVVYISHAALETMKMPDRDDYQRMSLKVVNTNTGSAIPFYVDNADAVINVRLQSVLRGKEGERKKVVSDGDREIVCHATAALVSKNPWGIKEAIDFPEGTNPLAPYLGMDEAEEEKPKRRRKPEVEQDPEDEVLEGDV